MAISDNIEKIIRTTLDTILSTAAFGISKQQDFSYFVSGTQTAVHDLGCRVLEEIFAEYERKFDEQRNKHRVIVRNRDKSRHLLTSLGQVTLKHTLYYDKDAARNFFAVDELLKLEKYSRIEQTYQAKLIENATISSYGKASALSGKAVSRQTVFNLVKKLRTIEAPPLKTTWEAKKIFIEADEDHIHLNDGNAAEMKLVYVHEGRDNTKKRTELINPRYFVSVRNNPDEIWDDVSDYLMTNYRAYRAEVHLSGDGASWIRAGTQIMPNIDYHLDKFHLQKAITNISRGNRTIHSKLRRAVYSGDAESFMSLSRSALQSANEGSTRRTVSNNILYIRGNFKYINRENRCSAEGHVSHVLSARLSSRPMGWSKDGAERMAKLRAFMFNKGDFLQLVKTGKKQIVPQPTPKLRYNRPKQNVSGLCGYTEPNTIPGIERTGDELSRRLRKIIGD